MAERKKILLRLDPAVHDALARWAGDELRSTNAQIEFLLRKALAEAGRMPRSARGMRGPGRPRKRDRDATDDTDDDTDDGDRTGGGTRDVPRAAGRSSGRDTRRTTTRTTTENAEDPPPGGDGE